MAPIDGGTAGNRTGYKVFSINTTVRNPKRNADFLRFFEQYEDKDFTDTLSYQYYFDLVVNGVYKFSELPEDVKQKYRNGETLSAQEAISAIRNNPQATGIHGRVMTQLRALKDQGFLIFRETGQKNVYKISITALGHDLINGEVDPTIIYSKAMIGMHAHSPIRKTLLNESRPFLNTLFVIAEVKKRWNEMGNEAKGILPHEFGAFVLSMKDCDYKKAVDEIIKYRKKFRYEVNMDYINNYLRENCILSLDANSICKDYPDEVFRKFEMTGLITKRGAHQYVYYDFSSFNIEKIELLLDYYKGYKSEKFYNQQEYYDFLNNVYIPWQKDEIIRKKIIESKENILGMTTSKNLPLNEQEEMLDRVFYNKALKKKVEDTSINLIYKELLILAGKINDKSKFDDISEPLRLEYLLSLLLGKKYGTEGLISNIIYNDEGVPLHVAPSGKCDIIYIHDDGSFILEPTMQRGRDQILNSETSNVARHVRAQTDETRINYHAMMVAPYVHPDVVDFFQYTISKDLSLEIAPVNIDIIAALVYVSNSISELAMNFSKIVNNLSSLNCNQYSDVINKFDATKTIHIIT